MPMLLPELLLPWPPIPNAGLQQIDPLNFENRLYSFQNIKSEGVPDLFAHPWVFSKILQRDVNAGSPEFHQFATLVKGIFLGVLEIDRVFLPGLDLFGQIAMDFNKEITDFIVLKYNNHPVGGIYSECLVFPSRCITGQIINDINTGNANMERRFGDINVKGQFRKWVNEITLLTNAAAQPIWIRKLHQMINAGGLWDATNINLAALPPLANRTLNLPAAIVDNGAGSTVNISLKRYIDQLVICQNNRQVVEINLSEKDIDLELSSEKEIRCIRDGNVLCGVECNVAGVGPVIDEIGFFERSPGQYIIWKDFDDASRPRGCTKIEYPSNDHAIFTFGNIRIRINGEVLTKGDILCESIISFDDKKNNIQKKADIPVRSEYLDCIDDDDITSTDGGAYQIKLRGLLNYITHVPKVISADQASIILWPSFKAPGWRVNYVYFHPIGAMSSNIQIRLINFQDGNIKILRPDDRIGDDRIKGSPQNKVYFLGRRRGEIV